MQIFISYAHENTAVVRGLVQILDAGGHSVWFDDQILPGQDWKRQLGRKIAASEAFLYALTRLSVDSEWCQWEFAEAARLQKFIIPVLMELTVKVPASLKTLQYADFTEGPTAIAAAKLMGALSSFQRVPDSNIPTAPEEPSGVPARAWESAKHWTDKIVTPQYKPQNAQEDLLGKFVASLRRGMESVGGRIIVTNQRLLFEAHGINLQKEPLSIKFDDIVGVTTYSSLGLVPNGIAVQCRSGKTFKFIAFNRKEIVDLINRHITAAPSVELKVSKPAGLKCARCGGDVGILDKFCGRCGTPTQSRPRG